MVSEGLNLRPAIDNAKGLHQVTYLPLNTPGHDEFKIRLDPLLTNMEIVRLEET